MSQLKAVLFDLDETLMARGQAVLCFIDRMIADFGPGFGVRDHDEIKRIVQQADGGGYRPKHEMYAELEDRLAWTGAPGWPAFQAYYRRVYPTCSVLEEGTLDVLTYFREKGLKLGLITNGETAVQQKKLDLLGIGQKFDSVVISESAGCKKPDPHIFRLSIGELGVSPNAAWYVGDHPRNDVYGAWCAGLRAVWKSGVHPWDVTLPVIPYGIIRQLTDVIRLYEKRNTAG